MAEVKVIVEPFMDIEGDAYQVLRYELNEELSELSELRCELSQLDVEPTAPANLLDKTASFTLKRSDGSQERQFVGRIIEAERRSDGDDVRTIHIVVAPVPWVLKKRSDCRVFQNLGVEDIVGQVLEKAGLDSQQFEWQLGGEHPERVYCAQYRESDFDFMRRLLSEEGIYFATRHADGKDKLILGDKSSGFGEVEGPTSLPFEHGHGHEQSRDLVTRLNKTNRVRSDKVMLRDYNFEKPKLQVEGTLESEDEGDHVLEIYDFPGRGSEAEDMDRLAQVRLDEVQADRDQVTGETGVLTLRAGLRFSIEAHPYAPLNQEYLVTQVNIVGGTPRVGAGAGANNNKRYRCSFRAVPITTRYAPPPRPRAAKVVGMQTAVTTGPGGEEIHVNDAGAVTIHYHWDRLGAEDDTSSCWVRSQQLALGDSMLLPRMNWEVSVEHLEGDPDRPMVMGRMYNAQTPPPYKLPDEAGMSSLQTATTPGGSSSNEMRMGDSAGAEEMFFNASKDMSIEVKNNTTESIGNNLSREIGSNQTKDITNSLTATVGGSQTVCVGGDQKIQIETRCQDEVGGDHTLNIGGTRTRMIGGDHKLDVGASSTLGVDGNNIDLVVGSVTHETLGSHSHKVGAALIDITPADRSLTVGGSITETAGAAKVIGTLAGRGVEVGGTLTHQVAGAIVNLADGDRSESAGATYTEIAAGAHVVKADNITIEADGMINLVMGASILSINPAMVTLMGVSLKLDGKTSDLGVLIIDN
jgi:type VI secretion system secreted protein VgrG